MGFCTLVAVILCVSILLQVGPVRMQGFITGCGGLLTSGHGNVTLPQYYLQDSYDLDCTWTINVSSSSPQRVELQFGEFLTAGRMPDCQEAYVEIFIGCTHHSLGRYCGEAFLPVFYSVDNCMKIRFVSNGVRKYQGFNASYSTRPESEEVAHYNSGCGTSVFNFVKQGNIFSPKWPMAYPKYVKCYWRVNTREDLMLKVIVMDFDIHKEKDCDRADSLNIRVGGNRGYNQGTEVISASERCGRRSPFLVDVHFNTFYLKFESDGVRKNRGFMIGFATFRIEDPNDFDPKVLIILGVIFGGMLVLGLKIYLQHLLFNTRIRATRKLRIQIEKMMEERGLAGRRYRKCDQEPPCDV